MIYVTLVWCPLEELIIFKYFLLPCYGRQSKAFVILLNSDWKAVTECVYWVLSAIAYKRIQIKIIHHNIPLMHFELITQLNKSTSRCGIQQGRQGQLSIKTLRSLLSAKFWRHFVLSGGTQRRALPRHQSEETKIW